MEHDKLLYGKSGEKRVVGIEVTDDTTELFIQEDNGNVVSKFVPNRFWILSNTNINGRFSKLEGSLHYCWGAQYKDRKEWARARAIWKTHEDIYTVWNQEEAFQIKDGVCMYQDLKLKDISLLSFDLETTGIDPKAPDAKILLISTTYRDQHRQVNKLFSYDDYANEGEFIEAFSDYINEVNPSIMIGHNIISFDIPYLQTRADKNNTILNWGRNGSAVSIDDFESKFRLDGSRELLYNNVKIYGREICDTLFLARSFDVSKAYETYALKPLIKQLGLEKEGRQHYDASLIRTNYLDPVEFSKIKQYAEEDSEDAVKLWDYMGAPKFYWAQKVPKPFTELLLGATGSQINSIMVRAYLQDRHSIPKADSVSKFDGGISIGVPGIYSNCIRWDVASLYPSIIIEYNVYDDTKDPKAYFLKLVTSLTATRLANKKLAKETGSKYYSDLEQSEKIGINSAYGFMGASGLNFNCVEAADFITEKGREILLRAIEWSTSLKEDEIMSLCPNQEEEETV